MEIATLVGILDQPDKAADHLRGWRLAEIDRGRELLLEIANCGLALDLLAALCEQLAEHLPGAPDPDAALAAFCRYLQSARSPLACAALLERDRSAMPMLLGALSLGPHWAELLVADPDAFDFLRQSEARPIEREALVADVVSEIPASSDERSIVATLGRFRARHLLRIAYGEVVGREPLERVLCQLSMLAEALLEAAYAAANRHLREMRPMTRGSQPEPGRACIAAAGRLGGRELAYAGQLDLLVMYEPPIADAHNVRLAHDHFDRVANLFVRLFNDACGGDSGWQARLMRLPDSPTDNAAHTAGDVILGFDSFGRTWHRQALLRARPVAGDLDWGAAVLDHLQSWLYRRYLGRADETGIKALKRRILMDATLHQDEWRDVQHARGSLRDIERTVEFLMLLAGGEHSAVRRAGSLVAIAGLEQAGAISREERTILERTWTELRQCEHRLQIVVGPGATCLPAEGAAIVRIAASLPAGLMQPADFLEQWRARLDRSWLTLQRLLESAFAQDSFTPREVELLLDPAPGADEARAGLGPFGFARPGQALATLQALAREQVPFLSTRRCRHWLAQILPRLLTEIAATPDPDAALDNLARISDSLGGKGVLWQLFESSPPTLQLYVRLCAASPYLADILTTNPGMIDELVDSLQLGKLPTRPELEGTLDELCRGAKDTLPVLHDFKSAQHLRIGVRDLVGDEDIDRTHAALADVAETCLTHLIEIETGRLVDKFGPPTLGPGPFEGEPCGGCVVALGQLGGRTPNYHSTLDLLFLYEGEGITRPLARSKQGQRTANNHFFTQLAQAVIKQATELTPKGRLYAVETPLRPIGLTGTLAISQTDFAQHFAGGAPLWQWLALCQARPIHGEGAGMETIGRLLRQLLAERPWQASDAEEIRRLRLQLQQGACDANLKRGAGGTLDVEFMVQRLQLEHAAAAPHILTPTTQVALLKLAEAGLLATDLAELLAHHYRLLRRIEAGLRLLNTSARHDLPADLATLGQLAFLVGHSNPQKLREQCLDAMRENREIFDRLLPVSA